MNPKGVGEKSEGIILAHMLRLGLVVSIPFGNNQKYDLIIDDGHTLLKAQCKTGWIERGCIVFNSSSRNTINGLRQSYRGQADIFLVYCPVTDRVYRVSVNDSPDSSGRLRLDPPKPKGNKTNIRWAKDFEI